MAPLPKLEKVPAEHVTKAYEPSTWKVISMLGGSLWLTYSIYSTAGRIWKWIQTKIESSAASNTSKPHKISRRDINVFPPGSTNVD
jgi:hypothetical protein